MQEGRKNPVAPRSWTGAEEKGRGSGRWRWRDRRGRGGEAGSEPGRTGRTGTARQGFTTAGEGRGLALGVTGCALAPGAGPWVARSRGQFPPPRAARVALARTHWGPLAGSGPSLAPRHPPSDQSTPRVA
ncbi:hypothetical protein BO71DRAFT_127169 [Aspergillus ellipticus CBS 707.79]|uniref:Uncharacterized protein n=1 Tax=Aspergillus ellipticus CBS 707.79 TaxID=1448320 RepID=A0A319ECI2_9EURO|nr:hypothetical protein BO71DRAFT_127169 [Aspergillus ellipticus CBS 707.79]